MAKMTAAEAAVRVMEREGVEHVFGIPGAAINPLYAAMKRRGSITHVLARHVEWDLYDGRAGHTDWRNFRRTVRLRRYANFRR